MHFVSAALPARRSFPIARAAALAWPSAWADPDPATRHPRNARATSRAPSPTTITTDFDSALTSAQPSQAVWVSAAPVRVPHMPDTPSRVGATDRDLVDTRNFVASDGALRYAPHLLIRKRFTGDRNSVFTGRDFDELHSERAGLVRADARLLSNSPGARNANPRRGRLIAPDDIEQVDALDDPLHGPLDGPFSVRRPDDWPGSTVRIATHRPDGYEAWIDTHSFSRHDDGPYGFAKPLPGGNRQAGDPPGNGAIHHDVCGAMSALLGADRKLRCCQPDRQWPVLPGTDSLAERRYAACRPACHPAPRRTFRGEHK